MMRRKNEALDTAYVVPILHLLPEGRERLKGRRTKSDRSAIVLPNGGHLEYLYGYRRRERGVHAAGSWHSSTNLRSTSVSFEASLMHCTTCCIDDPSLYLCKSLITPAMLAVMTQMQSR